MSHSCGSEFKIVFKRLHSILKMDANTNQNRLKRSKKFSRRLSSWSNRSKMQVFAVSWTQQWILSTSTWFFKALINWWQINKWWTVFLGGKIYCWMHKSKHSKRVRSILILMRSLNLSFWDKGRKKLPLRKIVRPQSI